MRVCPLFQCRLDKSLGLAVGLWPVRPGSFVLYTELMTRFTNFAGFVAGPIIRKDTLDLHALRRIPGNGMPEEFLSRFRRLVRVDRCVGHTRSVINANMQIFPAGTATTNLTCSRFSVSHTVNLPQSLDVDMQHLPGLFGNAAQEALPPERQAVNSQACARREKQNCGQVPAGPLLHLWSSVSAAGRRFPRMSFPSACFDSAWGVSFCPQAPRRRPVGNDFSIFWRYAGLRQTPRRRQRRAYCPSAEPFPLDLWA